MPAVRGGKGQDRRCCLLQGNPGGGGPTAGMGVGAGVGEDGTEETPGVSAEVSPDGHIGPKGLRWVTSVHFPNQIEFELLLFPRQQASPRASGKPGLDGPSASRLDHHPFLVPLPPSRGELMN